MVLPSASGSAMPTVHGHSKPTRRMDSVVGRAAPALAGSGRDMLMAGGAGPGHSDHLLDRRLALGGLLMLTALPPSHEDGRERTREPIDFRLGHRGGHLRGVSPSSV